MKILAFDPATKTGVAVGRPGERPVLTIETFGGSGSTHGAKFVQALITVRRLIDAHKPDAIALEAALAAGGGGAFDRNALAMGFRACILMAAYERNIKVREIAVSTIRKHFIGNGKLARAKAKAETQRRCRDLKWAYHDDNDADAAAVWDTACALWRLETTQPSRGLFGA